MVNDSSGDEALGQSAHGQDITALGETHFTQLETYIADAMAYARVPGMAVAIVQNGKVIYEKGFGVRLLGQEEPVTSETRMMIGSTGKTMTTFMMATLVDDQLMAWDTPVVKILPTFAVADPELTGKLQMWHMVSASTGIPRRDAELIFNSTTLTAEELVQSLHSFEFTTGFGEVYQYNNQMVAAGEYIAALAAGGSPDNLIAAYLAAMERRVFAPIGMLHTTFSSDQLEIEGNYALPHGINLAIAYALLDLTTEKNLVASAIPSGGSWSTVQDMARYLITQLQNGIAPSGKRVVSEKNLAVTRKPQVQMWPGTSYGLGWMISEYETLPLIFHGEIPLVLQPIWHFYLQPDWVS